VVMQDVRGMGPVLTLRAGQIVTMLGYWEQGTQFTCFPGTKVQILTLPAAETHVRIRGMDGVEGLCPRKYLKRYDGTSFSASLPESDSNRPQPLQPLGAEAAACYSNRPDADDTPWPRRHSLPPLACDYDQEEGGREGKERGTPLLRSGKERGTPLTYSAYLLY